jgi:hypothetical protein
MQGSIAILFGWLVGCLFVCLFAFFWFGVGI